jgi:hypothetical protein
MRGSRNISARLILAASLTGCAYDTGNNGQRPYGTSLGYSGGYGAYGGYGFNRGFSPSGGYVNGDAEGYDSGGFGSGYDSSGGIAGMHHYYGY